MKHILRNIRDYIKRTKNSINDRNAQKVFRHKALRLRILS